MIVKEIGHTSPQITALIISISTFIVYTVKRCATQYNLHCTYFIILFIIIIMTHNAQLPRHHRYGYTVHRIHILCKSKRLYLPRVLQLRATGRLSKTVRVTSREKFIIIGVLS